MTKTEFLNAYTALDINVQVWQSFNDGFHGRIPLETEKLVKRDYIEVERLVGGAEGGWYGMEDNFEYGQVSQEPEKPFEDLNKLLEAVAPRITSLLYKRLCKELIKKDYRQDNEWYGNYFLYQTKRVYLDDLYEWLKANNLFAA